MRTFPSSHASSANTMHTVSLRFFPFTRTVSPRNSCNSSIFAGDNATTELSSFTASSVRQMSVSRQIFFRVSQTVCCCFYSSSFRDFDAPQKKRSKRGAAVVRPSDTRSQTHTHMRARYVDPFDRRSSTEKHKRRDSLSSMTRRRPRSCRATRYNGTTHPAKRLDDTIQKKKSAIDDDDFDASRSR